MFNDFKKTPAKGKRKAPAQELTRTTAFLACCVSHKIRLSYGALAVAAKVLGENDSNQIAAQRGAGLVKTLPVELQPHVCRKKGDYAKGTTWATDIPGDLRQRDVITKDVVEGAVEEWLESLAKQAAEVEETEDDADDA